METQEPRAGSWEVTGDPATESGSVPKWDSGSFSCRVNINTKRAPGGFKNEENTHTHVCMHNRSI